MPGEKCRSGAGCVNSARPVLRGFRESIEHASRPRAPRRETDGQTEKRSWTLNSKDSVLLAGSKDCGVFEVESQLSVPRDVRRSPMLQRPAPTRIQHRINAGGTRVRQRSIHCDTAKLVRAVAVVSTIRSRTWDRD